MVLDKINKKLLVNFPGIRFVTSVVGFVVAFLLTAIELLKIYSIYVVYVFSIGDAYSSYISYRPVDIGSLHYRCQPSEFWFGQIIQ
jgi:hypothetical protein